MSTEAQLYETPARNLRQKPQQRTHLTKNMIQSKLQYGTQGAQSRMDPQTQNNLNQIEQNIKNIGEELRKVHQKMLTEPDKYSDNYLNLEQERKALRQQIIQLDYQHKMVIAKRVRESRIKNQQSSIQKEEQVIYQKQRESQQQPQVSSQIKNEQQKNNEDTLTQSRRKQRIAEIQSELVESRLRRSRIEALNAEMDYLKYGYLYGSEYYTYWRSYYAPSYSYGYYGYPYYSRWFY